jgi:hypothetical protein
MGAGRTVSLEQGKDLRSPALVHDLTYTIELNPSDPGAAGHAVDDPGGAVPVQPPAVAGQEERPVGALAHEMAQHITAAWPEPAARHRRAEIRLCTPQMTGPADHPGAPNGGSGASITRPVVMVRAVGSAR